MAHLNKTASRRRITFDRLTIVFLIIFLILAVITGVFVFRFVRDTITGWNITPLEGVSIQPTSAGNGSIVPAPEGALQPEGGLAAKPWDGKSRITILVMGLDYRDWEADEGPSRTDSMILLTIDPLSGTAGMLSIPRDMWVNIPGYDYHKINQAYYFGDLDQLPGGGPALAVKTVESFLGVPINYYAQIDFSAFERFIDEIGGVKVYVSEEITIDPIGPAPKVKMEPGSYVLPGDLALAYARSRKGTGDDFARAERQQQVILAVRDRILTFDQMPSLIAKAPKLYKELSSGIQTNLTLDQVIRLGLLALELPEDNIHKAVIGPSEIEIAKSPDGLDILIPYPDKIRLLRDQIFTSGDSISPVALGQDLKGLAAAEGARISIQNGTLTAGLAARTAEYFQTQGLNITEETNASEVYSLTTIYVLNGKPYTIKYIMDLMKIEDVRIYNRYEPNAEVDLIVTLGNDWASSTTLP